jgi:hypothetical protein
MRRPASTLRWTSSWASSENFTPFMAIQGPGCHAVPSLEIAAPRLPARYTLPQMVVTILDVFLDTADMCLACLSCASPLSLSSDTFL